MIDLKKLEEIVAYYENKSFGLGQSNSLIIAENIVDAIEEFYKYEDVYELLPFLVEVCPDVDFGIKSTFDADAFCCELKDIRKTDEWCKVCWFKFLTTES